MLQDTTKSYYPKEQRIGQTRKLKSSRKIEAFSE